MAPCPPLSAPLLTSPLLTPPCPPPLYRPDLLCLAVGTRILVRQGGSGEWVEDIHWAARLDEAWNVAAAEKAAAAAVAAAGAERAHFLPESEQARRAGEGGGVIKGGWWRSYYVACMADYVMGRDAIVDGRKADDGHGHVPDSPPPPLLSLQTAHKVSLGVRTANVPASEDLIKRSLAQVWGGRGMGGSCQRSMLGII